MVGVGEPDEERLTVGAFPAPGEFVDEPARLEPVHHEQFQVDEAGEVHFELRVTEREPLP